jgi:hypothetical protein
MNTECKIIVRIVFSLVGKENENIKSIGIGNNMDVIPLNLLLLKFKIMSRIQEKAKRKENANKRDLKAHISWGLIFNIEYVNQKAIKAGNQFISKYFKTTFIINLS